MPAIPFIGPTYTARSVNVDAQRTINLYPEVDPTSVGKGQQSPLVALYGTPGLRRVMTVPGVGGIRGLYAAGDGTLYAVQGREWYRWGADNSWYLLGTLLTSAGPVSMADNAFEVCLVDGEYGYLYNQSTQVFGQIGDPDFLGSQRVIYIDGYFAFTQPGTQRFYISQLLDGASLDGLDFASAESLSDPIVTLATNQREVWLFGQLSTEIWYDAGLPDFPFARIQGAVLEYGCQAVFSVAGVEGTLFLLGTTENGGRRVYRQQGYQLVPVSTHAVETALERMTRVDDALGFGYQQDGHGFYVLTFPTEEQTWAYDLTTGLWHERGCLGGDGVMRAWRPGSFAYWNNLALVGDRMDGRIYQLALDQYTDDGAAIPRIRTSPHYSGPELGWTFYHALQLDMETGAGRDAGLIPGRDPQAMLQWSDDGGHSWSNEHWTSCGKLGDYRARARWRRLGQSRDRVFRVTITDPVKVVLIGATIEATQEPR